jgi:uncharacterized protein
LGLVAVDTGLTLAGSPVSFTRMVNAMRSSSTQASQGNNELKVYQPSGDEGAGQVSATETTTNVEGLDVVTVNVENGGYFPDVVHAKANTPIRLRLVTNEVYSCAVAFVIPSMGVEQLLKPTGVAAIDIPAQVKGTKIPFSCSMGMFTGELVID